MKNYFYITFLVVVLGSWESIFSMSLPSDVKIERLQNVSTVTGLFKQLYDDVKKCGLTFDKKIKDCDCGAVELPRRFVN